MAKRYIGDAIITIEYVDGNEYRGTIRVSGHTWRFSDLHAPPAGFNFAYDSPRAYDEMAQSAVSFGSYYATGNRGDDAPDWAPSAETADAIAEATEWAMNDRGEYEVRRSAEGSAREAEHRVADFDSLDDLIKHARKEGATHVYKGHKSWGDPNEAYLYFPRGDGSYEEAGVYNERGYFHVPAQTSRGTVPQLPRNAYPIKDSRWEQRSVDLSESRETASDATRFKHLLHGTRFKFVDPTNQGHPGFGREDWTWVKTGHNTYRSPLSPPGRKYEHSTDVNVPVVPEHEEAHEMREAPPVHGGHAAEAGAGNPTTKPGKHGTLYLYEIKYTDPSDEGMGEMSMRRWAYNLEHVEERFYEGPGSEGWQIISIARVPESGGMHRAARHRPMRESSVVRDYIAVDRNDRKVAGPFRTRHEADRHVPEGGYVKFTSSQFRRPPPAPSSYPMFREGSKRGFRPGARVRVTDNDSMYRGWTGTVVSPDVNRTAHLGNHERALLQHGAVLVETGGGKLFVVYPHALVRKA